MHEPRISGVVIVWLLCTLHATAAVKTVGLDLVADTLAAPNLLTSANDATGRLFVVDQIGQIRIIDSDGTLLPTPFLDLSSKLVPLGAFGPGSFDERGLLGLAFHPSFSTNDTFYVYYSAPVEPDTIISFEEFDIPNGVMDFEFRGTDFSGAVVGTQFSPPLYCTGRKAFEVSANAAATITFPEPVVKVRFFFVHKATAGAGTVTAVLADGAELPAVPSNPATARCDSSNFVVLEDSGFPTIGIRQLRLAGGAGSGRVLFLDDLEVSSYNHKSRIAAFKVSLDDPDVADAQSEVVILEIPEPQFNHNAGMLAFGPDDDYLYISIGDGGNANDVGPFHNPATGNGQDTSTLLGKMLRIDIDGDDFPGDADRNYAIPPDNPFVGLPGRDEIWAFGLRNPFRFSFDSAASHRLFCADVGQDLFEEVNIIGRGDNLGWRTREGTHCFDPIMPTDPPADCPTTGPNGEPLVDPILEFPHVAPADQPQGIAVQGGFVYRGTEFPGIAGKYVFGDWSRGPFGGPIDGSIFVADEMISGEWGLAEPTISNFEGGRFGRFVLGFGQDANGEIYVCSSDNIAPSGNGQIHKIVPSAGDSDRDGVVDLVDHGKFQRCFTGSGGTINDGSCHVLDSDNDSDIDLGDFSRFRGNFTGP